jgi:hypothetical protein
MSWEDVTISMEVSHYGCTNWKNHLVVSFPGRARQSWGVPNREQTGIAEGMLAVSIEVINQN